MNFEKDRVELYADKNNWLTKIKILTQQEAIENLQIEQADVRLDLTQKFPLISKISYGIKILAIKSRSTNGIKHSNNSGLKKLKRPQI